MEILMMVLIGAAVLGLIWLIVREPEGVKLERARSAEDFRERLKQRDAELKQSGRLNAATSRAYVAPVTKPIDKPKPKTYSSSSSGNSSSRSSDDGFSSYSYSSYGGGSSSSSSSCDSSSSSSSSSSCD